MPFQSEKQRRYLWANEPEIARDWTNRYGAANGGIMDIASDGEFNHTFENYKKGNKVNVPTSFQARSHSTPVNLAYITDDEARILQTLKPDTPHDGPMGIPNYDDYDPTGGGYGRATTGAQMSGMETGSTGKNEQGRADARSLGMTQQDVRDIRSGAIASGAGQTVNPGWFGPRHRPGISKQDLRAAKQFAPKAYRATRGSPFGIGNLLSGAMSIFGGWPGKIGSMLSHINPGKLRGWNPITNDWNTQDEYEKARTNRRRQSRLDNLYSRKSLGKGFSQDNIDMLESKYGLQPSTAQNVLTGRDLNLRGQLNTPLTKQLSAPKRSWDNFAPPTGTHYPGSYDENDYYTGTLSFEDQVARNKAKLESLGFTEATDENLDPGWSAHRNMTHANAPQSIKDFYTNSFRSRYNDQGLASLNNQWSGPQIQQVKVTDAQKSMIDSAVKNYNLADSDFKNNPTLQKEVFDAAKKHDDKGSTGVWGMGKRDPEPMTRQEYRDYLVSKGYI